MKKIIFIITSSEVGGAQVWVRDQVKLLSQEFDIKVITNKSGWLSDSLIADQCYFVPEIESRFSLIALIKISRLLKREKVNIVVASSANAGLYGRISRLFLSFRCIYVSHGWSCLYNGGSFKRLFILVEWLLSFLTDAILCVSDNDRSKAIKHIKISESKLRVIRNGVWPSEKVKFSGPGQRLKILFVGRLQSPKRLDLLIEAVANNNDLELAIVGSGPLLKQLPKYENILFLGEIPSFSDFSNYDVFSLISDSEGLPMSALEAASSGVPLLMSDVGGCREVISEKVPNGIVVNNNVDSIRRAIKELQVNYEYYYQNALIFSESVDIRRKLSSYISIYVGG
jgi:glycosyltransferase involved in cell wall biosynthesis